MRVRGDVDDPCRGALPEAIQQQAGQQERAHVIGAERQLKAIGGWKSGVVSRYVHLAATETRDVVLKMNERILGK